MLNKKVIVISGGAGRIGRSLCAAVVDANAYVIVADSNGRAAEEVARKLGANATAAVMDITSEDSIQTVITEIADKYDKIDALVNCAYPRSKYYGKDFLDVTFDDFCQNLSLHLGGYFSSSRLFGKYFMENNGGNIINMSSVYGVVAPRFEIYKNTSMTMPVEYAAIKSALIHLTQYMAQYFKGHNVRVNTISPGGISDHQPDGFIKSYNRMCATKGMLDPDDLSGTLLFLLSDLSTYINGQNIVVDDGFTL